MCMINKTVQSLSHNVTYCNTLLCPMFGKIIKVSKIYIKSNNKVIS